MAIIGELEANFVANAVGHRCPRGGYDRVSRPCIFRDSLCTLSVIHVHYLSSWGQGVVEVAVVGIFVEDMPVLSVVSLASCAQRSQMEVLMAILDLSVGSKAHRESVLGLIESTVWYTSCTSWWKTALHCL